MVSAWLRMTFGFQIWQLATPKIGTMWQSSSCHVQQAQDGIKDTNLRRKHPEKNLCVQPSNPPRNCRLSSKKDSPFKASMWLARLQVQGFSTSNGGYVWYQAALEQPQWRNEGHQPGSLEMDTSGHSKATVKQHLCVQPSQKLPLVQQERFALTGWMRNAPENPWCRLTCPAWLLQGFSTSNGGYVRYLCQVHLAHHLLRMISGSARAAPMAKWRTPTWKFGDGHIGHDWGWPSDSKSDS